MSTLREAAKQALEALEGELPDWRTPAQARAVIALRDALAQEEQPKLAPAPGWCKHCRQYTVEEPLLAQQEQEPVLTMNKMGSLVECSPTVRAFDLSDGEYKLYTHPPRREWQSLSEDEIRAAYGKDLKYRDGDYERFARAIEAALKERNNG